ncbi:MAG: hypothetical protein KW806_01660 [Candidatus Yanofskybacteria bacterium]|nr:hypothetical protein [Candidatus Yanofskybacteria bacterium]
MKYFRLVFKYLQRQLGPAGSLITITVGLITIITTVYPQRVKIWIFTSHSFGRFLDFTELRDIPVILWIILPIFLSYFYRQRRKLNLVAGAFEDNFSGGLINWEYGQEDWKIITENGEKQLSITRSNDGGLTKRGFTWSDYEFSFNTKVINRSVGWIIRAENRTKYLMIQLNFEDDKPSLRLHLRVPGLGSSSWLILKESDLIINPLPKLMEWMQIKIRVLGGDVDVYINNVHVTHYYIQEPIKAKMIEEVDLRLKDEESYKPAQLSRKEVNLTYVAGRVGFRCYGSELALIKNVRIEPLFK